MKKIMVIDDEPAVRALVAASLEGDCEVALLADGREALAAVSQAQPDVILLDVRLPGISGVELLSRLRSDARTRSIPVLLLTGLEPPDDLHADGVLLKPFTPSSLRSTLAGWIAS